MDQQAIDPNYYAIAKVCHQANKAHCENNGDLSQKDWERAELWQREGMITGVVFHICNPNAPKDALHNAWMQNKIKDGWAYGPIKDATLKTHPCLVKYEDLPVFEQQKDAIIRGIIDALK